MESLQLGGLAFKVSREETIASDNYHASVFTFLRFVVQGCKSVIIPSQGLSPYGRLSGLIVVLFVCVTVCQ